MNPGMCSECRAAARRGPGPGAEIHRATAELVVLAAAVRPDWAEADVRAALAHAASVGMTWEQALVGMGRLMVDGHAHPRELVPDARDPLHPARPAAADVAHRGAQLARHLLPGPDREPS